MIISNEFKLLFKLILFTCYLKLISSGSFECQYDKFDLICYNFTDFSQLNFSDYEVNHVLIWPSNPLILDETLNLNDLNYNLTVRNNIDFYNIKGIDYKTDPFKEKKTFDFFIKFYQTDFRIFDNGLIMNENNCELDFVDDNFINFFTKLSQLEIEYGGNTNKTLICPIIFKNANINSITFQDISSPGLIEFIKINSNQNLNSKIDSLNLVKVNISLNNDFLNELVFANIKYLTIELSNIEHIKTDLFKNFKKLKNFLINVIDFNVFFTQKVGTEWINYLNYDVVVDLNNETDINSNIDQQFKLILNDWYGGNDSFLYTDDEFCFFSDFPHNKLIFPVINIGQNKLLNCSCTVLFLVQYRKYYNKTLDPTNDIELDSVNHCLNENFPQNILECNFDQKISDCHSNSNTTFTEQDLTTSSNLVTTSSEGCPIFHPFCSCNQFCKCIICENYGNLSVLTEVFNKINYSLTYERLEIVSNEIFLDNDFDISNLKFSNEVIDVEMRNLVGMTYDVNPFGESNNKRINLFINYEKFEIYYNKSSILDQYLCNWNITNDIAFKNIITHTVNLTIIPNVQKSTNKICPLIFKNAYLSSFVTAFTKDISFSFYELSDENELNATILSVTIAQSKFFLDSKILNKMIFMNTKKIFIEYSDLYGIEPYVFKPLSKLKRLYITVFNLDQFFNNGTEWLRFLNYQVNVDLNNQTDIQNNISNQFTLIFGNLIGQFYYKDEDFCLFKNFPHQHLVFPFIFSGDSKLNCTCTIIWLIQYRQYYNHTQDEEHIVDSDSVTYCIDENFQSRIEQCRFENRLKNCSDVHTTVEVQTTPAITSANIPDTCENLGRYCNCGENYIACNNFENFSDIDFSNYNISIYDFYIILKPYFFTKIIFDNSLDMSGLGLIYNSKIQLNLDNLFGIDVEVNPFRSRKNVSLNISIGNNSLINVFKENRILDDQTCNWNIIDNSRAFQNIFSDIKELELKPNYKTTYSCPLIFLNANIDKLIIEGHAYKFYDLDQHQNKSLNSSIKALSISMRQFYLDSKTLNKNVFSQTVEMSFQAYNFYGIQDEAFKEFDLLKQLSVISSDFSSFIKNGTKWMNTLNYKVFVDEINNNTVSENEKNAMALFLVDILQDYFYPDEDICVFRDFPHKHLVVPIFLPFENTLNCTCTLLYLIQYRILYDQSFFQYSQMIIDAASKCIDDNFQRRIMECEFESQFQNCSSSYTTSISSSSMKTVSTTATSKSTSSTVNTIQSLIKEKTKTINYLIAGIAIIGFLAFVLIILIIVIGFKFFTFKKIAKNEEFSLIPSDMLLTDD